MILTCLAVCTNVRHAKSQTNCNFSVCSLLKHKCALCSVFTRASFSPHNIAPRNADLFAFNLLHFMLIGFLRFGISHLYFCCCILQCHWRHIKVWATKSQRICLFAAPRQVEIPIVSNLRLKFAHRTNGSIWYWLCRSIYTGFQFLITERQVLAHYKWGNQNIVRGKRYEIRSVILKPSHACNNSAKYVSYLRWCSHSVQPTQ